MGLERIATLADAAEIKAFLSAFLERTVPIANMRARIQDPNIITVFNPGKGYGQIKARPKEASAKVEALFPRAPPGENNLDVLKPILDKALREVVVRYPASVKYRDVLTWRVWAQFWDPKGEDGRFDGGEGAVRAWAAAYPRGVVDIVRPEKPGGAWTGESTIGRMIA